MCSPTSNKPEHEGWPSAPMSRTWPRCGPPRKRSKKDLGPIQLWVNVAFVGALRYLLGYRPTRCSAAITDVTYLGQVNGTRVALEYMRPRDSGVIVQVGSALAFRGIPLQSAYCGAKHAIIGFTESVITELKHDNSAVKVCMVQLPAVNTVQFDWNDSEFEQHPMPVAPIFQPELPARAVRYLADHPRRNMWVGASTAATILGNRVAPWLLDWYLGKSGVKGQLTTKAARDTGPTCSNPKTSEHDRGAHGMFDDQAHTRDPWSAASMKRRPLVLSATATAALAALWARRR